MRTASGHQALNADHDHEKPKMASHVVRLPGYRSTEKMSSPLRQMISCSYSDTELQENEMGTLIIDRRGD